MHMGVHVDLSSNGPAVPPDVVPVGMIVLVHPRPDLSRREPGSRVGLAHMYRRARHRQITPFRHVMRTSNTHAGRNTIPSGVTGRPLDGADGLRRAISDNANTVHAGAP